MTAATEDDPLDPLDRLDLLARSQDGAVARRQLRALGVPRSLVRSHLRGRRWQRVLPGTFVVFTGPLPYRTRIWVALLYAGKHAVASHRTTAWLWGLRSEPPGVVEVVVPHGRRHRPSRGGVRVRQSRHVATRRYPGLSPPRIGLDDTVLDLTDQAVSSGDVVDLVLQACQRRLTTPDRLAAAARRRRRMRWRRLVADLLTEAREGVASPLELRYARDVARAHGLPRGRRNVADGGRGSRRYRDVRYPRWRVVVELDGQGAHPENRRERDHLRDNALMEQDGTRSLRYGWSSVTADPCGTARQVATVLRAAGWPGESRPCGPGCAVTPR